MFEYIFHSTHCRAKIETTSCSILERQRQQQWSQTTHETTPYGFDDYGLVLANGEIIKDPSLAAMSLPQQHHYLYNFNPFFKSALQESEFFKVPNVFAQETHLFFSHSHLSLMKSSVGSNYWGHASVVNLRHLYGQTVIIVLL